jgi:regulator of protease activity HflC (stomatin/prohibitin superfamily)
MEIKVKHIVAVALLLVGLIIVASLIQFKTIRGEEVAVKETWTNGVLDEVFQPKTYILFPAFMQKLYPYKVNQQVYVMNDDANDYAEGREKDSYLVQSADQQDMRISLAVQWRRDPTKIVELHKTVGDNVEERILRPELQRIVKDKATVKTALEAYSGVGLVNLQNDILKTLRDPNGELAKRGVLVDNFVIQHIGLDPKYVTEITERQVAIQARLKNIEQTKAAEAEAEKAKAVAQAGYETSVVEAERDKAVGILQAQKMAEQQVLGAEAEKKKVVLAAEAEKESGELRAQAIIAVGNAEAEATKMKMLAYSGSGAQNFVQMEVAKSMAEAYKGIKGYIPEKLNATILTENFQKGVSVLANPPTPAQGN